MIPYAPPMSSQPKFVAPGVGPRIPGPGGDISILKLVAAESGGLLSLTEYICQPNAGPPLHMHAHEDETFWILEGEITFSVDGKKIVAGAGAMVYGPRAVPHAFKNLTGHPARMLLIVTPPANFEAFYAKIGVPNPDGSTPTEQQVKERIGRLAPVHGMTILGANPL